MLQPTVHRLIHWGMLLNEKQCLERATVSWTLSQGQIKVLLWTEEDVKRPERNPLSATVKKQRKLVYVQRGVGIDKRPYPQGASRGHCLCRWRLTEPGSFLRSCRSNSEGRRFVSILQHSQTVSLWKTDECFFINHSKSNEMSSLHNPCCFEIVTKKFRYLKKQPI